MGENGKWGGRQNHRRYGESCYLSIYLRVLGPLEQNFSAGARASEKSRRLLRRPSPSHCPPRSLP
eukprot:375487-Pyramimonas_sp.AAC.1